MYALLSWLAVGILSLFVICKCSARCTYYTKISLFWLVCLLLSTIVPLPMFFIRPRHWKNALGPAMGCRMLLRSLGITVEVRGVEHIRRDRGATVLINHQSSIDIAVLAHLWPIIGRPTVVAKRLVKYIFPPCYGWGTLFIDRANRADALGTMNAQSVAIAEKAAKLLVFPEGTRGGQTLDLLPFKKGPFHVAVQSQAGMQPVVVSRYWFLDGVRKRFGAGHIIISIMPEIDCGGLDKTDVDSLLASTQQLMQTEYERISAESQLARDQ